MGIGMNGARVASWRAVLRRPLVLTSLVVVLAAAGAAWAVLGDPNATMTINNGAAYTNTTAVTINSNVTDAVDMSFSPTFKQIDAGSTWACGIATDGSLWAWGTMGSTVVTRPSRVGADNDWKYVSVGQTAAAIKNDGTLWTFESNGTPTKINTWTNWSTVSAGGYHILALRTDGALYAWGTGSSGQLGTGGTSTYYSPVYIMANVKAISGGFNHSAAVTNDGKLYTWGDNTYGQLGDATTTRRNYPTQVGSVNGTYQNVNAGNGYTLAQLSTGAWLASGQNNWGQYGSGTYDSFTQFFTGPGSGWTNIWTEGGHSVALKADGTLWTWGLSPEGAGTTPRQIGTATDWIAGGVGDYASFGIKSSGAFSWGRGQYGVLGNGGTTDVQYTGPASLEYWQPYAANLSYTLAATQGSAIVTARYRDASSNVITLSDSIILDSVAPSGAMYINGGLDYTTSRTVQLNFSVFPAGDGVDVSIDGGAWVPYSTPMTYTMPAGEGLKTVSAIVRDGAGNTATFVDSVTLDTVAPTGTMSIAGGAATTPTRRPLIISNVTGANSLIAETGQWRQVSAGQNFTLAIDSAGGLWGWGSNTNGEIGDGSDSGDSWSRQSGYRMQPTRVFGDRVWAKVDAGTNYAVAIDTSGKMYAWGYNGTGQLGNGTTSNCSMPVPVSIDGTWTAVSAGGSHTLAIRSDGTLWGWGSNSNGELGQGGGSSTYLTPVQIGTDNDWAAVAAGGSTFALKKDGSLWSCGYNWDGQLGQGTEYPTYRVLALGRVGTGNDWAEVSSAGSHTVARKTDGTLWSWGRGYGGVLGLGDTANRKSPTQIGMDTDWTGISGGLNGGAALKADGSIYAWGYNYYGGLGNGLRTESNVPVRFGTDHDYTAVIAGGSTTIAITDTNNLRGAGYACSLANKTANTGDYAVVAPESVGWMRYVAGVPVLLPDTVDPVTVQVTYADNAGNTLQLSDSIRIAPGSGPSMVINDGATRATSTTLKTTTSLPGATNVRMGRKWQRVHAGFGYTMLHIQDGPVEFAGVGNMAEGGDGLLTFRTTTFSPGGGNIIWKDYSAGDQHSVGIARDGSLWTWGYNTSGELGVTAQQSASPICIDSVNDYLSVAGGMHVSFAVRADGTLWAWGENAYGQLGNGTKTKTSRMVQVGTDTDWKSVSNWGTHTVGLKKDGTLLAWGLGNSGQLGQGDLLERLTPTVVQPGTKWLAAEAGVDHTVAIKSDGTLWTWGANGSGQIGDGTTTNRTTPTRIGLYQWKTVAAGMWCTLAIRADGTLWVWGNDSGSQLGDGGITNRTTPYKLGTRNDWVSVDSGGTTDFGQTARYHSVGATADGRIFTWGYNGWGGLGDGTYTNRTSPVEITRSPLYTYYDSWTNAYPWASGETTINVCYTLADGSPLWLGDSIYIVPPGPSISNLQPVFGSVAETSSPLISAKVLVNSGAMPATVEVRVDGLVVPSSYDGNISNKVTAVVGGLSDDTTHTATVTVTDAAGSTATASTSFLLEKGTKMPHWTAQADCRTCHGSAVPHTNSVCYTPTANEEERCMTCHLGVHGTHPEDPYPRYYYCQCHYYSTAGTPNWTHRLNPATCKTCHTMFQNGQDPSPPETVRHTVEVPNCTPCHRHELRFEHARRTNDAGVAYGCNTCHTSAVARVQTAITGRNTACAACHDPVDHVTPHVSSFAGGTNCGTCHSATLDVEHVTNRGLDCEVCHSSTNTAVVNALRTKSKACNACHPDGHPHPVAQITGVMANGEKECTACHSTDLVTEHSKSTSQKNGSTCDTCHVAGGPRDQIIGAWDQKCDTPACHAAGSARAVHENYCLACHSTLQPNFATSKTSFDVTGSVNRDTACKACHVGSLVGTHPYHQTGANCGAACHPGWGNTLATAVPLYNDPTSGASFATAQSKDTSPGRLHVIHATPRWPKDVGLFNPDGTTRNTCGSCHATAACNMCHTGAIPATHTTHSAVGGGGLPSYAAWVGKMSHGVVGGNLDMVTGYIEANQCASTSCHNASAAAARTPRVVEDFNYVAGGNPDDPAGTSSAITLTGTWRYKASARYTGGRMSYNNVAGNSLSAAITGNRVDIVSDKDPYRGTAEVLVDGVVVGTFDSYSSTTKYQAVVYSVDVTSGPHTVTVRPLGKNPSSRGAYVVVDAFRVYSPIPDSIAPTCSSCHTTRVANHW